MKMQQLQIQIQEQPEEEGEMYGYDDDVSIERQRAMEDRARGSMQVKASRIIADVWFSYDNDGEWHGAMPDADGAKIRVKTWRHLLKKLEKAGATHISHYVGCHEKIVKIEDMA